MSSGRFKRPRSGPKTLSRPSNATTLNTDHDDDFVSMTQEEQANDVSWIDSPVKDRNAKVQSKMNISTLQENGARKGVRPPRIKFGKTNGKVEESIQNDKSLEKMSIKVIMPEINCIDRAKVVETLINNENLTVIASNKLIPSSVVSIVNNGVNTGMSYNNINGYEHNIKYTQASSCAKSIDEIQFPREGKNDISHLSPLTNVANGTVLAGIVESSIVSKESPHSLPDDLLLQIEIPAKDELPSQVNEIENKSLLDVSDDLLMQIEIPLSHKIREHSCEKDNKVLSDVSDDLLMQIEIPSNYHQHIPGLVNKNLTQPFVSDEMLMQLVVDSAKHVNGSFNQIKVDNVTKELSDDALMGIKVGIEEASCSVSPKHRDFANGEVSDDLLMQIDLNYGCHDDKKLNLRGRSTTSVANCESVKSFRFVALDIHDDVNNNRKEIRCFKEDTYCRAYGDITNHIFSVILTEDWYYTEINEGDLFHVIDLEYSCVDEAVSTCEPNISKFNHADDVITLTNKFGLLVMHPDIMLSPTRISEVSSCLRKSVISERVRVFESSNPAVLGNTRHMFVELVMAACFNRLQGLNMSNVDASMLITEKETQEIMKECIKKYLLDLYVSGFTDDIIRARLREIFECIVHWIKQSFVNGASSIHKENQGFKADIIPDICYTLKQMISAEESIWSPSLGIKGQIDIITKSRLEKVVGKDFAQHIGKNFVVPVELKTGKRHPNVQVTHKAQVLLYILSLLVREKSSGAKTISNNALTSVRHGMLIYLNDNECVLDTVVPTWHELRSLMSSRNLLAFQIKKSRDMDSRILPNMLKRSFECENCFQASECMVYHAALENGNAKSSGVTTLFSYVTNGLNAAHLAYLRHWDKLIDLEAIAVSTIHNQIWTVPSAILENGYHGFKCIGNLRIVSCTKQTTSAEGYTITLNAVNAAREIKLCSFLVGEKVILSIEYFCEFETHVEKEEVVDIEDISSYKSRSKTSRTSVSYLRPWDVSNVEPHITTGIITSFENNEICVSVSNEPRRLIQVMLLGPAAAKWSIRLDEDENSNVSINTMRANLLAFFTSPHNINVFKESKNSQKKVASSDVMDTDNDFLLENQIRKRGLIVDLLPPIFKNPKDLADDVTMFAPANFTMDQYRIALSAYDQYLVSISQGTSSLSLDNEVHLLGGLTIFPGCDPYVLHREYCALNGGQKAAFRKVLIAEDYTLILGLPGTGKSSTLSLIVRTLIARHQKVMISAYTHSAVDNLLLKLSEAGVSPKISLRLGSLSSINPELHSYAFDLNKLNSINELNSRISSIRLVAVTALYAARNPLVKTFKLDWCIVDEAGQISQPSTLGAIKCAKRFVLVGDDCQLPPLIVSEEALQKGMDESLLKRLHEAHPEATCCLKDQYRMNEEIMSICNFLIYENRMCCGAPEVAVQRLHLPLLNSGLFVVNEVMHWLKTTIDPSNPVVFLNTDHMESCGDVQSSNSMPTDRETVNKAEVMIVKILVENLELCGLSRRSIGILSPFRSQVHALNSILNTSGGTNQGNHILNKKESYEISTIDKFQGRDKDCIIFSSVRSLLDGSAGNLLRDWRRVNVAVTRARKKLIMIGSVTVLQQIPVLDELIKLMKSKQCIVNLPRVVQMP